MSRKTTPTHVLLNQITLAATGSSVAFSNIPQNYTDLKLVWNGKSTNLDYSIRGIINGDSGSNYSEVYMYAGSGGAGSGTYANTYFYAAAPAGYSRTTCILNFMDYSAIDKHKLILSRGNMDGSYVMAIVGRWANTAAITSIQLYAAGDAWAIGTTISLYGIAA